MTKSHQVFNHRWSVICLLLTTMMSVSYAQPPVHEKSLAAVNQTTRMQTGRVCEEQAPMRYPTRARQLGIEGELEMEFVIGDGVTPIDIKIFRSQLNKYSAIGVDGKPQDVTNIFDDDAIKFIKSFHCATHNSQGKIPKSIVRVPLIFSLSGDVKK
jgi:hypothetical protein